MEFIQPLLLWFKENARDLPWRQTADPYRIWVSEIMLQQTRVQAVIQYYARFLAVFPDVYALSRADDALLNKMWEGLGYYSRARSLKKAACEIVSRFSGTLPADYDELLSLPGFGEYTAGAVASIACSLPVPAVDGNVLRVWARLNNDFACIDEPAVRSGVRTALTRILPKETPGAFNQAMMELGATVCLPNGAPRCTSCPLAPFCKALQADTVSALPVRRAKRPRRIEYKTVFVLETPEGYLGFQREKTGLLASLYQLPEAPGVLNADAAAAQIGAWGLCPAGEVRRYERKHVFTHIEWHMRVFSLQVTGTPSADWIVLGQAHALPTAYRVCLS